MSEPAKNERLYHLAGVVKEYNGRRVLDVDHLDIFQGEILTLVGPSGAGKSTLLRLLNFLEAHTRGRLVYRGTVINPGSEPALEIRRQVTTVFQRPLLLNRSVQANVRFGLQLRGEHAAAGRIQAALEEVGLHRLARQKARTLSGGEAQRVALARALVIQPQVLLLDEPTANLDPYNAGLIENIIQRRRREFNTTLVLVTHNVFQARRLADRVGFLMDGKLVEVATAGDFFNQPKDARTAAFARGEMIY